MQGLHVVDHPVLARAVTELRAATTPRAEFRTALGHAAGMLAYEALRAGGTAPAVLSGADEAAVAAFLAGRAPFPAIAAALEHALSHHHPRPVASVEDAVDASHEGRRLADAYLAAAARAS